MSRRDQIFQAVNSVQGQVYGFLDSHVGNAGGPSQPQTGGNGGGGQPPGTETALPLYAGTQGGHGSQPLPPALLNAPPGQAQMIADQMPQSRIANGSGREARAAAAALRDEQLRSGQLKTKHTFISSGARIILDIHTVPQKTLTFMGGTAERGRGAMKGTVTVHAQPNERISSIRLKIKAVVRVMVPRTGTPQQPALLERTHPGVEACVEKEVLLLQLESQLYDAKANASPDAGDPTLLAVGPHEYPFTIDLPSQTGNGVDLPPSFVLAPLNKPEQVQKPQPKSKWEAITSSIPVPLASSDWASVKWYVKLTVERPGLLRSNERIFAPFVYLPPPPAAPGMSEQIGRRPRLAAECDSLLRQFHAIQGARPIDLQRLHEPLAQWETIKLAYGQTRKAPAPAAVPKADGKDGGKPGFFSKMLFGAQSQPEKPVSAWKEVFTLHLPKKPFVFALRSGVPFVISRHVIWTGRGTLNPSSLSRLPTVGLFQRANVYARGKGPVAGTTLRYLATGRQPPDTQPVSVREERSGAGQSQQSNRRTEYWLGIVDLPPGCAPCFETPALTLEYAIGVRGPTSAELIHSEPIVLVCPPSKPIRVVVPSQPPSRSGTPNSEAARRRKQGSADVTVAGGASGSQTQTGAGKLATRPSLPPASKPASGTPKPAVAPTRPLPSRPAHQTGEDVTAAAALAEKRAMQARYDEQARFHAAGANGAGPSTSARPPDIATANSQPPQPPQPPPRLQQVPIETQAMQNISIQDPAPISAVAPLTPLDDVSVNESNNWQFLDDELTDLPPSYFEATGMNDRD